MGHSPPKLDMTLCVKGTPGLAATAIWPDIGTLMHIKSPCPAQERGHNLCLATTKGDLLLIMLVMVSPRLQILCRYTLKFL